MKRLAIQYSLLRLKLCKDYNSITCWGHVCGEVVVGKVNPPHTLVFYRKC